MANHKRAHENEDALLVLENKYWEAIRDKDLDAALALTADPCVVAGASGVGTLGHEQFRKMIQEAKWQLHDFQMKDAKVTLLGKDLAIVAYRVHEDLTVDDERVSLDAADASTWVRRDGTWRCVLHTESLAGDPFGRDRTAATG